MAVKPKDRQLLALLYEREEFGALKRYIEDERFNISTKMLLVDPADIRTISKMQGQAEALKRLYQQIKIFAKASPKD